MSMTREELRQWFAEWLDDYYDGLYSEDDLTPEVAESVLAALRPVSRERVEKVFHGCEMCREEKKVKSDNFCGAATMRIVGDSITEPLI